jgi:hypothetical protein
MHPLALTTYPRGVDVTRSRSRRRRTRRAVIAVVVGLLGTGSGQAFADAPQHLPGSHANVHQRSSWGSVDPSRPFGGPHLAPFGGPQHAPNPHHIGLGRIQPPVTDGRTVPADQPSGNGSFDAWPGVLIVMAAAVLGAVTLARRHRLPTAT